MIFLEMFVAFAATMAFAVIFKVSRIDILRDRRFSRRGGVFVYT